MNVAYEIGKNNLQAAARSAADRDRVRASERAQSKRMLVALALLMVAIGVVAFRDRQFLFESEPTPKQAVVEKAAAQLTLNSPRAEEVNRSASSPEPENAAAKSAVNTAPTGTQPAAQPNPAPKAGATHAKQPLATTGKTAKSEQHSNLGTTAAGVTLQAAQRARLSDVTVQAPDTVLYPRLDQRTKVEGSVELQALVGTDGSIQELHVVRGPAVLGSAAREAVLQWKFKPYMQNGVAVETYARVTVNFTIKVVDGSPKTVAAVEPEHVIILADNYQR